MRLRLARALVCLFTLSAFSTAHAMDHALSSGFAATKGGFGAGNSKQSQPKAQEPKDNSDKMGGNYGPGNAAMGAERRKSSDIPITELPPSEEGADEPQPVEEAPVPSSGDAPGSIGY